MKIEIKVTEKRPVTVTKEIDLPYYAKRVLIGEYVSIVAENKILAVYSGKDYHSVSMNTDKHDVSSYFGDDYLPISADEFHTAMDAAVKAVNSGLSEFVGIETSLLP